MWLLKCVVFISIFSVGFTKPERSPKIVIVGAGLAGISAAAKLMENGFEDIIILEAENRTGGRIYSVPFANGGNIDLGAQWIHGETNNVVHDLAYGYFKFGDTGYDKTNLTFLKSSGKPADQTQCLKLTELAEKILTSWSDQAKFRGSLGEFFTKRYKSALKLATYSDIMPDLSQQILDYYQKEMNIWNGSETWFDISARGNTISGVNEGNQFLTWSDKGYQTVFDFITKKQPDPSKALDVFSKIQLSKKVVNMKRFSFPHLQKSEVLCEDGAKFTADHVIFTGSLGVLKHKHTALFTPWLPLRKIIAIDTIGYGTLGKIFLQFEEPFWPTDVNQWVDYSFLWTQEDIKALRGTDKEWLIKIRSFTRVDAFPDTIEALLAGKNMKQFEELSDEKVIAHCKWLLEKFLAKPIPTPISMKKTKWLTNTNFYGSYSYQSVRADRNRILPKDLAQSVMSLYNKPLLLFAGEATDDQFASNAHGAISSGWRAAKEIIEFSLK